MMVPENVASESKAKVVIIPPTSTEHKCLRVAGYCRISTDYACQETSIENQRLHYKAYIEDHPDWTLVDIYWEIGVSGTKAETRPQLQRLLADCENGRIDLVITKSISRFSRNTSDLLEMVRRLDGLGIPIWFEKENLHTDRMGTEFLLTVLGAFSQEESHSISANMKWGIRKRFEAGTYRAARAPYGYRKEPKPVNRGCLSTNDTVYVVEPAEAEIVRRIFCACLSGKGASVTARELNADGISTWSAKNGFPATRWTARAVLNILHNIFYTGDILYQKTFMDDAYHQVKNKGQIRQYLREGSHEAIIDQETFGKAQEMIRQRRKPHGVDGSKAVWKTRTGEQFMPVRVIMAQDHGANTAGSEAGKLRVCAYCRVSSDSDEQETSYEAQVTHYTSLINGNAAWAMAGIFADQGISGTQAKTRPEFNRMIAECEAGHIDLVITKSISRFARNTLDCISYIRKLKELSIPILFEKESINTMESSGEVLVTILASIAQQESASISANVRMGIEFGFQEGHGRLNYSVFLGYRQAGKPGTYAIVPREADIVRRIYREYLEGYSPNMICEGLTADGIHTPAGKDRWYASTIQSILENEKYAGDLLMQKYYTKDFLTHTVLRNTGQRPQYFVEDDHAPIVPRAVYDQVQGEKKRRAGLKHDPGKLRFGSRLALNGRLICGKCGRTLKRYAKPDESLTDWRCRQRAMRKKSDTKEQPGSRCDCRIVKERDVQQAVLMAFDELPKRKGDLLALQEQLRDALCAERAEHANRLVQVRILLELAEQMGHSAADTEHRGDGEEAADGSCRDYEDFFRRTAYHVPDGLMEEGRLVRFDNGMVIRYLDRIVVEEEGYTVRFKAGIEIRQILSKTN